MKNWKTTIFGAITALGIALTPSTDPILHKVGIACSIIGLFLFGLVAKDFNVSGTIKLLLLGFCLSLTSCVTSETTTTYTDSKGHEVKSVTKSNQYDATATYRTAQAAALLAPYVLDKQPTRTIMSDK